MVGGGGGVADDGDVLYVLEHQGLLGRDVAGRPGDPGGPSVVRQVVVLRELNLYVGVLAVRTRPVTGPVGETTVRRPLPQTGHALKCGRIEQCAGVQPAQRVGGPGRRTPGYRATVQHREGMVGGGVRQGARVGCAGALPLAVDDDLPVVRGHDEPQALVLVPLQGRDLDIADPADGHAAVELLDIRAEVDLGVGDVVPGGVLHRYVTAVQLALGRGEFRLAEAAQ
nr:hypothetical protein [Streptomyces sp. MUSC 14]